MKHMIGIVDYNAGNITSVERALKSLDIKFIRSKNPSDFAECERLIFPGVGEAEYAMKQLKETGLLDFIKNWASSKKPLLGICLGSQIIFDFSEEGNVNCLGLIPGKIMHFNSVWNKSNATLKVPHMGWNNLSYSNGKCALLNDVPENSDFYFVHSYLIQPENENVIKASADYGVKVPACIQKENIYACQFHPEKSGKTGLQILKNFCTLPVNENGELTC